jgi:hypothetical protein
MRDLITSIFRFYYLTIKLFMLKNIKCINTSYATALKWRSRNSKEVGAR